MQTWASLPGLVKTFLEDGGHSDMEGVGVSSYSRNSFFVQARPSFRNLLERMVFKTVVVDICYDTVIGEAK